MIKICGRMGSFLVWDWCDKSEDRENGPFISDQLEAQEMGWV